MKLCLVFRPVLPPDPPRECEGEAMRCAPVNGVCVRNPEKFIENIGKVCGSCAHKDEEPPTVPVKAAPKPVAPVAKKPVGNLRAVMNDMAIDFLDALPTRLDGEMLIRGRTPTVAAIITARNEGDWVVRTIESVLKGGVDRVVLVDDNSDDGSCDFRKLPSETIILKRKHSLGVGVGRNDAFNAAGTDVCITADAHVLVPEGSLRNMANWAYEHQCIMQPAITDTLAGKDISYATNLLYCPKMGVFEHKYTLERPPMRYCRSGVMYGSVYVVPKIVFRRMGGFTDNFIYGYNEMDHTVRAAMCGVPIWNDTETIVKHKFKKVFNYPFDKRETVLNYAMSMFVCFEDETFDEFLWPAFFSFFGKQWKVEKKDVTENRRMREERDAFREKKVLTDKEFFLDHVIYFTERDRSVRHWRRREIDGE